MALKKFNFNVAKNDGYARLGKITTHRGPIDTPAFMPVGTHGAIKALPPSELIDMEAKIILSNTYHLHLTPGSDLIKKQEGYINI